MGCLPMVGYVELADKMRFLRYIRCSVGRIPVNVQPHRICFVIGLLMCNRTLCRPLPRICGTAERLQSRGLASFFCSW